MIDEHIKNDEKTGSAIWDDFDNKAEHQVTEPEINNYNRKKTMFETFPSSWQDVFLKIQKRVGAFMNIHEKQEAKENQKRG